MPTTAFLTRQNLESAFCELGLKARAADKIVEIAVYDGSALVLTLPGRAATKDVDAVMHHDQVWLREAVAALAEEKGWPPDWLNDGVKGWLSHRDADPEAKQLFKTYPSEDEPGLRVFLASPHYLFAVKCLAIRIGGVDGSQDRSDIETLARHIGIVTVEQALDIVSQYYPLLRISPKTHFGIQEIFPPARDPKS
jgi:hypothetical protein